MHLQYIKLLCNFNSDGVLPYLMGSASYPLEATLAVVRSAGLWEAVAYLKEHTGDTKGALEVRAHFTRYLYIHPLTRMHARVIQHGRFAIYRSFARLSMQKPPR